MKKKKKILIDNKEKCQSCNKNPAKTPHTCPFKTEINDDKSICNCCNECEKECCWDI